MENACSSPLIQIRKGIYLGTLAHASNLDILSKNKISSILCIIKDQIQDLKKSLKQQHRQQQQQQQQKQQQNQHQQQNLESASQKIISNTNTNNNSSSNIFNFEFLAIEADDLSGEDVLSYFDSAFEFIENSLAKNQNVLVHW